MSEEMKFRLFQLLAERAGCLVSDIKPESKLVADLGIDSLDLIETCMDVEEQFGVEIDDDEAHAALPGTLQVLPIHLLVDHIEKGLGRFAELAAIRTEGGVIAVGGDVDGQVKKREAVAARPGLAGVEPI